MQSDNRLIKKIKTKQDKNAANKLIKKYYKEIYAYTYRQLGECEMAMDLTQEIFIAVIKGLPTFDGKKAQFRTWLYRVASNKITDYYRSRSYKICQMEQLVYAHEEQAGYIADVGRQSEMQPDILQTILSRERIRQVMEVVSTYDEGYVRIFQKKCFEEKTFLEIAKEEKLSENTVKTRFYTMMRRLKQEVESDE